VAGFLQSGTLNVGDKVYVFATGSSQNFDSTRHVLQLATTATVMQMQINYKSVNTAKNGCFVGTIYRLMNIK
jgi:hypothetical protein